MHTCIHTHFKKRKDKETHTQTYTHAYTINDSRMTLQTRVLPSFYCSPGDRAPTYYPKTSYHRVLCNNHWGKYHTLFFLLSLYLIKSKINVKTSLGQRLWTSLNKAMATGIVYKKEKRKTSFKHRTQLHYYGNLGYKKNDSRINTDIQMEPNTPSPTTHPSKSITAETSKKSRDCFHEWTYSTGYVP